MDNLARGWAIVTAHGHVNAAVWIAILVPLFIAVWFGFWTVRGKRDGDDDDQPAAETAGANCRAATETVRRQRARPKSWCRSRRTRWRWDC